MTIDQMRTIALMATPGTWKPDGGMDLFVFDEQNNMICDIEARGVGAGRTDHDMASNIRFIAAFNPKVVLRLLQRIEMLTMAAVVFRDQMLHMYSAGVGDKIIELDEVLCEYGSEMDESHDQK